MSPLHCPVETVPSPDAGTSRQERLASKWSAPQHQPRMRGDVYGNAMLSCWDVGAGEVRIQTRSPAFRRNIRQLQGFRLVAEDHAGGYLKVYQGPMKLAAAVRFVDRRWSAFMNEAENATTTQSLESGMSVLGKGERKTAFTGRSLEVHT